ncbi:MAG: hypothetical protein NVS3B20_19840 [Polyangiales bacterium]
MREFLARNEVDHRFVDVRKGPLSRKSTLALVRTHAKALFKVGGIVRSLDPKEATDEEIARAFLGREGSMRAPVMSNGTTVVAGFDETSLAALLR